MLLWLRIIFGKKGQGVVEYAILLTFIIVLAAFLFTTGGLRDEVTSTFNSTASILRN